MISYFNSNSGVGLAEAEIFHIPGISELYKSVHISESNLEEKLDTDHSDSFSKTGGMFKVLEKDFLEYMILSDEYRVIVAVSYKTQKIVGYVSYHLNGRERYDEPKIKETYSELSAEEYARFKESLKKGKAAYGVDMITLPAWRRKNISVRLQHRVYAGLKKMGYTHAFYEIYTVIEEKSELVNPNKTLVVSVFNAKMAGCLFKKIQIGSRFVNVRSDFHLLDLQKFEAGKTNWKVKFNDFKN